ncbi:MAG: hypothetical protein K2O32_10160 [Acetatifactor sp.]|nr:hypothetical protein [Acetatifactor sp.]
MKNITKKQVFALVVVLVIGVCAVVYSMVFSDYKTKTEALKASNDTLEAEVNELEQYFVNMGTYKAQQKQMLEDIEVRTADYPGDAKEEDAIMMAVDMNATAIINFQSIGIGASENIHSIASGVVTAAGTEEYKEQIDFVEKTATYSNITDYGNLKACVEKIYASPYRVGIDAISYRKVSDENLQIEGTIDIAYYSIKGMNKDYVLPDMPEYMDGIGELFGVINKETGTVDLSVVPEEENAAN